MVLKELILTVSNLAEGVVFKGLIFNSLSFERIWWS